MNESKNSVVRMGLLCGALFVFLPRLSIEAFYILNLALCIYGIFISYANMVEHWSRRPDAKTYTAVVRWTTVRVLTLCLSSCILITTHKTPRGLDSESAFYVLVFTSAAALMSLCLVLT